MNTKFKRIHTMFFLFAITIVLIWTVAIIFSVKINTCNKTPLVLYILHGLIWFFGLISIAFALHKAKIHIVEYCQARQKSLLYKNNLSHIAVDAQVDTFFVFDPSTGKALNWNKSFSEISGYSDAEIAVMKAPDDYYDENDLLKAAAATDRIIEEGHAVIEMALISKSGEKIPTEYSASIIKDEKGNPEYFIAIGRDLRKRQSSEVLLSEKTIFLDTILETAAVSMWISDEHGSAIRTNQACLDFFGATREEVIGKYNIYKDNVILEAGLMPDVEDVFSKGIVADMTLDYNFGSVDHVDVENATHKVIRTIITPVKNIYGKVTNAIVQAIDLTEIKNAEKALLVSNKKYRSLYKETPVIMHSIDPEGRLISVSRKWLEVFGYTRDEVVGRRSSDFLTEESAVLARDVILPEFFKAGYCNDVAYQFVKKNGEVFDALLSATAEKDEHGTIVRSLAVIIDVTKRKQAEDEIKKSLLEKEILIRELYHRTKNNMQVISSLLSLQAAASNNEEIDKIVKETNNRINSMALVHKKLYQSQDLSNINVREYIEELARLLLDSYGVANENIVLDMQITNIFISIDIAMPFGLILNELISNTLKYAFPDNQTGRITVKLTRGNAGIIEIVYTDNGIGVPEDFDFRNQHTLGIQNVIAITEHQLSGEVEFFSDTGLTYIITFDEEKFKKRL